PCCFKRLPGFSRGLAKTGCWFSVYSKRWRCRECPLLGRSGRSRWTNPAGLGQKLPPSIPHRSALRCSLFLERPTPCAWTYADRPFELSREVTLVAEAALQ